MVYSSRGPSALAVWSKDLKALKKWGSKAATLQNIWPEWCAGRTPLPRAVLSHSAPRPLFSSLDLLLPPSLLNMLSNMGEKTLMKELRRLEETPRESHKHYGLCKLEKRFVWSKSNISPSSLAFTLILTLVPPLQAWHRIDLGKK